MKPIRYLSVLVASKRDKHRLTLLKIMHQSAKADRNLKLLEARLCRLETKVRQKLTAKQVE
jgi:uncharacterized tellurite resistance protein B-like protein